MLPEDIHSFELGYEYKKEETTFISIIYYRYRYNGLTRILTTSGNTTIYAELGFKTGNIKEKGSDHIYGFRRLQFRKAEVND